MSSDLTIQIVYASTSGNVEVVAETLSHLLDGVGIASSLHRSEQTNPIILDENQVFIFGTSTWAHGRVNPHFDKFLAEMKEKDLTGKKAAFFGCGDLRYEPVYFNEGIKTIKREFVNRGGQMIGDILEIDGEPYVLLDNFVTDWTKSLITELEKL